MSEKLSPDSLSITGRVKIILFKEDSSIVVYDGPNTFQTVGYNYLKNALITSGSFDPVQTMVMTHSGGTNEESTNAEDLGTGSMKFTAVWGTGVAYTDIEQFTLKATSAEYSVLNVVKFDKTTEYSLTVEWTISFA